MNAGSVLPAFGRKAGCIAIAIALAAPMPVFSQRSLAPVDGSIVSNELPRGLGRFIYKADGKRLSDVLSDFAAAQSAPAIVDARVEGVVSGNFATSPREFLDGISRAYSLMWYFDGTAFYFYPSSAIQSRIFRLKGYSRKQVVELLDSLHLSSSRYPIRFDPANSTLLVYGPPRHVELVGLAIESLDIGAIEGNKRIARVYALRYASAGDRQMGSTIVPGIVSTLQSVFGAGNKTASKIGGPAHREGARQLSPVEKVMQSVVNNNKSSKMLPDFSSSESNGATDKAGSIATPRSVRSPVGEDMDEDTPIFEADEGSNSVIVYAKARRMEQYEQLIRKLDVQPTLVEIEATVIDVSTDSLKKIGIDWSLGGKRAQISLTSPESSGGAALNSGISGTPFQISTLVGNAGRELLARIQALEGDGRARVVSKPRVLGFANRPAVMTDKRIANVRVSGNLEANLFQVEAGTMLQITPQVAKGTYGLPPQIKLSLYIEDGSFESAIVDQVPVVKKTEIRTEARVNEGESLLIGGISVEADHDGTTGVPFLKDIPYIGALFRTTSQRRARMERMFLLTPRVIATAETAGATATVPPEGVMPAASSALAASAPAVAPAVAPAAIERPLASKDTIPRAADVTSSNPRPRSEDECLANLLGRISSGAGPVFGPHPERQQPTKAAQGRTASGSSESCR
jgi:type III secretion protein C